MYHRLRKLCVAIGASMLLAQGAIAEPSRQTTVDFDPAVAALFQKTYGTKEADVLRAAILGSLASKVSLEAIPSGLTLKVTVRNVAPTHPTSSPVRRTFAARSTRRSSAASSVGTSTR